MPFVLTSYAPRQQTVASSTSDNDCTHTILTKKIGENAVAKLSLDGFNLITSFAFTCYFLLKVGPAWHFAESNETQEWTGAVTTTKVVLPLPWFSVTENRKSFYIYTPHDWQKCKSWQDLIEQATQNKNVRKFQAEGNKHSYITSNSAKVLVTVKAISSLNNYFQKLIIFLRNAIWPHYPVHTLF